MSENRKARQPERSRLTTRRSFSSTRGCLRRPHLELILKSLYTLEPKMYPAVGNRAFLTPRAIVSFIFEGYLHEVCVPPPPRECRLFNVCTRTSGFDVDGTDRRIEKYKGGVS